VSVPASSPPLGALRAFILYGVLGGCPLWFSIAYTWIGSRGLSAGAHSEYWTAAPWLIIGGALGTVYTMAIAALAHVVHNKARGSRGQRLAAAIVFFIVATAVAVAVL
jgi:hypothetical protein